MRDFRKLNIWVDSMKLVKDIYLVTNELPSDEKFGLKNQIQRAVVSIPSNIAEGSSRSSQKEFKYFLEMALGSAFELETQLLIIDEVLLIEHKIASVIFDQLRLIQKQINALINKIKANN